MFMYNKRKNALLSPIGSQAQIRLTKAQSFSGPLNRSVPNHVAIAIKTLFTFEVEDGCFSGALGRLLKNYTRAPFLLTSSIDQALLALEFEKKLCRTSFRKAFGQGLPNPATLRTSIGLLNSGPTIDSSQWVKGAKKKLLFSQNKTDGRLEDTGFDNHQPNQGAQVCANLCFKSADNIKTIKTIDVDKSFLHSGVLLMSSDWVLERLVNQIKNKRSVRGVVYAQMRDAEALLNHLQTSSPVIGVRITATGRLGRKKKAMSQQLTRSIGKVPLGTLSQKVDYSQGFVVTKFGLVGLKVWIAFAKTM